MKPLFCHFCIYYCIYTQYIYTFCIDFFICVFQFLLYFGTPLPLRSFYSLQGWVPSESTFAPCRTYANWRFFASRVVPPLRIIDSLRPRRIGIYPSRRRVLTKGYVKTRRAGGELLRKGISRYPHGTKAIYYRGILYRQAKKTQKKFAYVQFLLYLCSRF